MGWVESGSGRGVSLNKEMAVYEHTRGRAEKGENETHASRVAEVLTRLGFQTRHSAINGSLLAFSAPGVRRRSLGNCSFCCVPLPLLPATFLSPFPPSPF